jgi:hypothetical protein
MSGPRNGGCAATLITVLLGTSAACSRFALPPDPATASRFGSTNGAVCDVRRSAVVDIPCSTEAPRVVAYTANHATNTYGVVAVEGCGQRLTYMEGGGSQPCVLIGRLPIAPTAPTAGAPPR